MNVHTDSASMQSGCGPHVTDETEELDDDVEDVKLLEEETEDTEELDDDVEDVKLLEEEYDASDDEVYPSLLS